MSTRFVYDRQARTYDTTRAASPSVVAPLLEALAGAPGDRLLDVGGGTGNYAAALRDHGFAPVVSDLNAAMLSRAAAKGLETVVADAAALPFEDGSYDAVTLVSMIHHVPAWPAALAEARRVLRPGGCLALMGWAREHVDAVTWLHAYFPSARAWMEEIHAPLAAYAAELPGFRAIPVFYEDTIDLSASALQRHPTLLLSDELRRSTSYFERLATEAPDELAEGTARLAADLEAGVDPRERVAAARAVHGDAFVLAWARPCS